VGGVTPLLKLFLVENVGVQIMAKKKQT